MNIIKIEKNNMVNGDGLRTVIWCAGCNHYCKNCQNPEAQNPNIGTPFGDWVFDELKSQLDKKEISGVTFSGGECTYSGNIDDSTKIMKWIKENYPNKTIWAYTGYLYEDIKNFEMMKYFDVLIDGQYVEALNPGIGKLLWRGSSNQRIIDVKASLQAKDIIIKE